MYRYFYIDYLSKSNDYPLGMISEAFTNNFEP